MKFEAGAAAHTLKTITHAYKISIIGAGIPAVEPDFI